MTNELLQERIYPEIPDGVYQIILDFTSDNDKPNAKTKWICQQYINGKMGELDDHLFSFEVSNLLYSYDKFKSKLKPIMDYKDKFELEDDIIRLRNSGYETNSELSKKASEGAKRVYNDKNYSVYHIKTYDACKKYGSNTTWCITNRTNDEVFNDYKEMANGEIYFIIDKKNKDIKYACVKDCLYSEMDELLMVVSKTDEQLNKLISGTIITSMELAWRIKDDPTLLNVIPYGFPTFNKDDVIKSCKHIYKREMGKDLD